MSCKEALSGFSLRGATMKHLLPEPGFLMDHY